MAEVNDQVQTPDVSAPAAQPEVQAPAAPAAAPAMNQREEGGFDGRGTVTPPPAQREAPVVAPATPPAEAPAPAVQPPVADAPPAEAPASNGETADPPAEAPATKGDGGFVVPDSLSTLFGEADAPAPEEVKPEAKPESANKYANDSARVIGEYLAQGGTMDDVQVYQNQEQLKSMSDFDIVVNAYQKQNPGVDKDVIIAHLENKHGGALVQKEKSGTNGEKVTVPVNKAAEFGLSQEAKGFRKEIETTIAKVAGVVDQVATPGESGSQQPNTDPQSDQARATQDSQLALRAARDVLDQNPEFSIAASHDGVESTVKVKLTDEQRAAIEGPLAATVAQIKSLPQFQKIDHTNATQFNQAVQDATERLAFAFTYKKTAADIFADGVSKGREQEVQRAAGLSGPNIYRRGGSAPTGAKNGANSEFDKFRKADAFS